MFDDSNPSSGLGISHFRDIVLNCHSDLVKGIIVDEASECTFDFNPDITGELSVTEYNWDFGDGNTSTLESPSHSYSSDGIYKVTLVIKDENGCCTTVETAVFCGEEPICVSYLCWEDFINYFDCANGVKVTLPSGVSQPIAFQSMPNPIECLDQFYSSPIPAERQVVGGHCEIKQLLIQAIQSTGYDAVVLDYRDDLEECYKDQVPPIDPSSKLPGFFVTSEVVVNYIYGTDCSGNSTGLNNFFIDKGCN